MENKKMIKLSRIGWSLLCGFLFSLVAYFTTTVSWDLPFETMQFRYLEKYHSPLSGQDENWKDSAVLIDIHYDKIIADEYSAEGSVVGGTVVTDHAKLLDLLNYLYEKKDYRFILMDIILDRQIPQECDDSLKRLISRMPNLIIPLPDNDDSQSLLDKAGEVSYIKADEKVMKYPYLFMGGKSIPLKMYEQLHRRTIREHSFALYRWYTDDGLCTSNIFLTYEFLPPTIHSKQEDDSNTYTIHRLGPDFLDGDSLHAGGLEQLDTRNKYILIGDFEGDIHQTLVGDMSGTSILFNAYISLVKGKHRIGWPFIWIVFFLLTALSYYVLSINPFEGRQSSSDVTTWRQLLRKVYDKFMGWFYTKIIFFTLLFSLVIYLWQNTLYNILITACCFILLKWVNRGVKAYKCRKNSIDFFSKWLLK